MERVHFISGERLKCVNPNFWWLQNIAIHLQAAADIGIFSFPIFFGFYDIQLMSNLLNHLLLWQLTSFWWIIILENSLEIYESSMGLASEVADSSPIKEYSGFSEDTRDTIKKKRTKRIFISYTGVNIQHLFQYNTNSAEYCVHRFASSLICWSIIPYTQLTEDTTPLRASIDARRVKLSILTEFRVGFSMDHWISSSRCARRCNQPKNELVNWMSHW